MKLIVYVHILHTNVLYHSFHYTISQIDVANSNGLKIHCEIKQQKN